MIEQDYKVGIIFFAGDSWWEAGICDAKTGDFAGFIQKVENDVKAVKETLGDKYTLYASELVHSDEEAIRIARLFNEKKVDTIIICPMIWTNDPPIIAFLQEAIKVPVLLWAYNPHHGIKDYYKIAEWLRVSGPVSVQQTSNILKRFDWNYSVVFGNEREDEVIRKIDCTVKAGTTIASLKDTTIAVIPAPCKVVASTWVDDFFLLEKFGTKLEYISVDYLHNKISSISDKKAKEYVSYLKETFPVINADDDLLLDAARQAVGIVKIIEEMKLSGIALEDFNDDIYRILGFRPHLYHPKMGELGCTIGFEADVLNVLSTIIAGRLAGKIGMFNEFFVVDKDWNKVLMGHPGYGEASFGDPDTFTVTPDLEFDETEKRGAWLSYRAKPGEMTFLNFTAEYGKLKAAVFNGVALKGPRMMEGYAHMLVETKINSVALLENIILDGLIQHWGTVYGNIIPEIKWFMNFLNLEVKDYSELLKTHY
jgi:L-fucose isomerase-like protein